MKKYIVLLVATAFIGTGCKDKYAEGFSAGESAGTSEGQTNGFNDGYSNGYDSSYQTNYNSGFSSGVDSGYASGYADGEVYYTNNDNYGAGFTDGFNDNYGIGQTDGYNDAFDIAYNNAYNPAFNNGTQDGAVDGAVDGSTDGAVAGSQDGYQDGYADGEAIEYNVGYNDGYADGDQDGYTNGFNVGYDDGEYDGFDYGYDLGAADGDYDGAIDGYNAGYDVGFDDGYDYGLGLSTKSSNPSVKLAAMVNADLIDYSNLQKFDSTTAGSMALSHADNGTVDMGKLAALKEQHYLNQMAGQLNAKFGLSADRAQEIAIVAHQYNKLAGTRELTEKDADVFAVSIIGKNMKDIETAVKESMKGNSDLLNEVLTTVGSKNGISPERTMDVINAIFY